MSSSGVPVSAESINTFQNLKLKKTLKYILYNISKDLTEIVVDKTGDASYEEFLGLLPEDECRWAIYDFHYEKPDGGQRSKITFLSWSPDNAKIKQKMLFASSRDALKRSLTGVAIEIQGSDLSEVAHEIVLEKANRSA